MDRASFVVSHWESLKIRRSGPHRSISSCRGLFKTSKSKSLGCVVSPQVITAANCISEIRSNRFEPFSLLFWHVTNLEAFSTCLEPKYMSSRIFWKFWFKSVLVLATRSKITQRCKNTFRKHFATNKKRSIGNEETHLPITCLWNAFRTCGQLHDCV